MKKLMIALAACLATGYVSAYAPPPPASVVSSNVVGYYTIQKFDDVNAWTGQSLVKIGGENQTLASMFEISQLHDTDQVQIWNSGSISFDAYTWNTDHWEDAGLSVVGVDIPDIQVPTGFGFFMISSGPIILAGQVKGASVTTSLPSGYSHQSLAFPVPFNVDSYDWSNLAVGDQIQVWNSGSISFDALSWNGTSFEDAGLNEVHGIVAGIGESVFFYVSNNTSFVQNNPI